VKGAEGISSRQGIARHVILKRLARLRLRWLERAGVIRLHPEVGYEFFEVSVISPPHMLEEKLVHA